MRPLTIMILGATGDLTARKLIPALFRLDRAGLLRPNTMILGVARSPLNTAEFRTKIEPAVRASFSGLHQEWNPAEWEAFASKIEYQPGDAEKNGGLDGVAGFLAKRDGADVGDRLYYLSLAPQHYESAAWTLGAPRFAQETGGFRRLVIEKPFGRDLASARRLNKILHAHFREDQLFRIDHYLGKETVQNILTFRFANTLFEPIWNHHYIDHVQITVAEKEGIGTRGNTYEGSGVLRDMFQSHLLQVLTMIAMENPGRYEADRLRNEKIKVLDAVQLLPPNSASKCVSVGQYEGYRNETGVAPDSRTPTYAAVRLQINNWRWRGVPFYLRSGKGLRSRYSEVMIQFQCPPHVIFPLRPNESIQSNRLTMVLQPNEGIRLSFQTKRPSVDGHLIQSRDLAFTYQHAFRETALPEAYERLLLDSIQGEATLFMRADEIEQAWAIMDPLIQASEHPDAPLPETYPLGWDGPTSGNELLEREGRSWQPIG